MDGNQTGLVYLGSFLYQAIGYAGLLDYGARFYDPGVGRWLSQDLMAETTLNVSPYAYVLNSPVNYIDLFGLFPQSPVPVTPEEWASVGYIPEAVCNSDPTRLTRKDILARNATLSFLDQTARWAASVDPWIGGGYYTGFPTASKMMAAYPARERISYQPVASDASSVNAFAITNSIINSDATLVEGYGGITRVGSNGKLYFGSKAGRVFKGNQYVKTHSLKGIASKVGKVTGVIGYAATTMAIADDIGEGNIAKGIARGVVAAGISLTKLVPVYGSAISAGLGYVDVMWGEQIYDGVQYGWDVTYNWVSGWFD